MNLPLQILNTCLSRVTRIVYSFMQYLKSVHPIAHRICERFALLLCIGFIWAFAAILTAAGAYNNVGEQTKMSCRIDRSYLMSSAPWYVMSR